MKVKKGRELLEGYSGNELYQQGCKLFRSEVDNLITLRSYGKKPTQGIIESAINQVKDWFIKVAEGLPWSESGTPKNIISWGTGSIWVEYGFIDPKIEEYKKRSRLEILKGTPFPLFEALTPEALDALSSMMLGQMKVEATLYLKREEFAKRMGKRVCPYGEKERFCKYQEAYSMVTDIPSYTDDLVFVCIIDKCIREE